MTAARIAYVVLFLGLAVLSYEFLGAGATPSERAQAVAWWKPAGWARSLDWELLTPLREIGAATVQARHEGRFEPRSLIPFGLFALPAVAATALGFALFRSAVARAALLALGITLCAFSYYGWLDFETWQDYGWRWPAVLLSTAGCIGMFALGPALVASARRRSRALQIAALAAFAVPIWLLSIEVTGTNPRLAWNLSPWPTLTLYGFLLVGLSLGVIELAAGAGLLARARGPDARGMALGVLAAVAVALALHGVPFERATPFRVAALALPAAAVVLLAGSTREALAAKALACLAAGALIVASIKAGQLHAERFLAAARDEISPAVIDAIERYRAKHGEYPPELGALVPGELAAIRQPRIGWLDWDEEVFTYTELGDSFLLEFSGPLWVECAYSPPFEKEAEDAAPGAEVERLEASWSCERKPPRLW